MTDWQYKSARDQGLGPQERWKSLGRESGLAASCFQGLTGLFLRLYFRLYHRLRVIDRPEFPRDRACIIIANHASHLDALIILAAVPGYCRHRLYPVAAGEVFFTHPSKSFFSGLLLNLLPIWRKKAGAHALETLRERLVEDSLVYALFPEGKRSRDGSMDVFRPGIGMFVAGADVDVFPGWISGAFEALHPEHRFPRPRPISLKFGTPRNFKLLNNDRESWMKIASELEQAVRELGGSSGAKVQAASDVSASSPLPPSAP